MIQVRNLRVVSFSLSYQDIHWEVVPTLEDLQEYDFWVDRSEAEYGPWVVLAGPMVDRYHLRDNDLHMLSLSRTHFYRLRYAHRRTEEEGTVGPTSRSGGLSPDALEIIRSHEVVLREHVGTKFWLFPRKSFGQRCPQCWDRALGKVTDDQCPTCWATGFSGGYHYPVGFWAQMDPAERAEQLTQFTHLQPQYASMRMGPTPTLAPGDLLVDHKNGRWRINTVNSMTRLGVPVHQRPTLVRVQHGSLEQSVPLLVDAASEQLVPDRVFTNPQVPGTAGADLSDILGAYGYRG